MIRINDRMRRILFAVCVSASLFLQPPLLGMHCRCPWGSWSSRFIEGAIALDIALLFHTVVAVRRHRFLSDCLVTAGLLITSFVWIPWIYRGVTAAYLLVVEGRVETLGH